MHLKEANRLKPRNQKKKLLRKNLRQRRKPQLKKKNQRKRRKKRLLLKMRKPQPRKSPKRRRLKPLKTSLLLQLKRNQRKKQPRSPQRRLQKLRPQPKNRQQLNRTIGIILMMTQLLKL